MDMEIEVYHQLGGFTRSFQDLLDLNYREDFAGFEIDPETPDRGFVVYDRVYLNQACKSLIIQLQSQEKQTWIKYILLFQMYQCVMIVII